MYQPLKLPHLDKSFIQNLIKKGFITALHDRSDGGVIGALSEMSFANQVGFKINLESYSKYCGIGSWESLLFNEELCVIIEVDYLGHARV